jgi:hypothetical protein
MNKKIFGLLTALMFVVSGCSLSSVPVLNKILPKETVTKIVFQQNEKIDSLVDFAKKADALAKEKWASDAMLKTIRFSNADSFFTYNAEFTSDLVKTKEGKPGDLTVFYNYASAGMINSDLDGLRVEDFSAKENSVLIGNSCIKSVLCGNISFISPGEKIDPNNLKITSADVDKCFKTFKNGTLIVVADRINNVIPGGTVVLQCGLFRMNAYTGQVIASGSASSTTLNSSANNLATSTPVIATTTEKISSSAQSVINPNKDSDNDGLTDADEAKYGTNSNNSDTDGDGFKDGAEIASGYNPLGSGKMTTAQLALANKIDIADQSKTPAHLISADKIVLMEEFMSKNKESLAGLQAYNFQTDQLGNIHIRFNFYVNDVKAAQTIYHFSSDGFLKSVTDRQSASMYANISTVPKISESQAVLIASSSAAFVLKLGNSSNEKLIFTASKEFFRLNGGKDLVLAWRVARTGHEYPYVIVDAQTGKVLYSDDGIRY